MYLLQERKLRQKFHYEIEYLYEGGPFGSYKNKRNSESVRKEVAKELAHVAKTALLDNLYTKIGELIKEHIDNNEKMYLNYNNSGLSLVGKNRNNESVYSYWTDVNASDWKIQMLFLFLDQFLKII